MIEPTYQSWGRFPVATPKDVVHASAISAENISSVPTPLLCYGRGRSYGDVCLNDAGTIVDMSNHVKVLEFDITNGVVKVQSGCTIGALLDIVVPKGWFVPVSPGTKHVTLGGAVANDIHGKNHHGAGTFGCHVRSLELMRSNGTTMICTPNENADLFRATIGGLGLTGIVLWVELALIPIKSRRMVKETLKVGSLDALVAALVEADESWEYTVAWIDILARGSSRGRGLVERARFSHVADNTLTKPSAKPIFAIPFQAPSWFLQRFVISVFNSLWYARQRSRYSKTVTDYEPFFYPLDAVKDWNLLYGKRGMLQYQCVVPLEGGVEVLDEILQTLQSKNIASFLAVVKVFGSVVSPGMLSFPRKGLTLSLDLPMCGPDLFECLDRCDSIVLRAGGRIYPAKDARVSASVFAAMYSNIDEFRHFIDPACSSSFWRRVVETEFKEAR